VFFELIYFALLELRPHKIILLSALDKAEARPVPNAPEPIIPILFML